MQQKQLNKDKYFRKAYLHYQIPYDFLISMYGTLDFYFVEIQEQLQRSDSNPICIIVYLYMKISYNSLHSMHETILLM
jgi:hypothetical protein